MRVSLSTRSVQKSGDARGNCLIGCPSAIGVARRGPKGPWLPSNVWKI